jgi:hypothetical protein
LLASAIGGQKETQGLPKVYQNFTELNHFPFFTAYAPGDQQPGQNNGALERGALPGR